jgi:hypothetical protein
MAISFMILVAFFPAFCNICDFFVIVLLRLFFICYNNLNYNRFTSSTILRDLLIAFDNFYELCAGFHNKDGLVLNIINNILCSDKFLSLTVVIFQDIMIVLVFVLEKIQTIIEFILIFLYWFDNPIILFLS